MTIRLRIRIWSRGPRFIRLGIAEVPRPERPPEPARSARAAECFRPVRFGLPWRGIALSCLFHSTAVLLLAAWSDIFPPAERALDLSRLRYEPLTIHVPDRLYFSVRRAPADTEVPAHKPGRAPARRAIASRDDGAQRAANVQARQGAPPAFQLPELARSSPGTQTILQPAYPPDLEAMANVTLPQVIFWSAPDGEATSKPARRTVVPGRQSQAVAPDFQETPQLQPPKPGTGITVYPADVPPSDPHLGPHPRMPLRTFRPPAPVPHPTSTIDVLLGDPTALIALNPRPLALDLVPTFVVPPGNQMAQFHAGAPGEGAADAPSASGPSSAQSAAVVSMSGKGRGPASTTGQTSRTAEEGGERAGASPARGGPSPVSPPTRIVTIDPFAPAQSPASSPPQVVRLEGIVPIRIEHPATGVFDVVFQSAAEEVIPEAEGLLEGRPVYTVYVKVGGPKEWILQYCPHSGPKNPSARFISLGGPAPLRSPYPQITVVPPHGAYTHDVLVLIRASLTSAGQLDRVRAARPEDTVVAALLIPFLRQWQFRPATQDGRPVSVEALIVIPPSRT